MKKLRFFFVALQKSTRYSSNSKFDEGEVFMIEPIIYYIKYVLARLSNNKDFGIGIRRAGGGCIRL